VAVGITLIVLGLWGALIPLLGPYFNYGYSPNTAWHLTTNRLWLEILPGAAVVLGGVILIVSSRRASGVLGASLALAGGVWFIVGPAVSMVWTTRAGGLLHVGVGAPIGGHNRAAAEAIGLFYGLGVFIIVLAAFALARFVWRPGLSERPLAASRSPRVTPAPAEPATQAEPPARVRDREHALH
jgi:hypothetical protein